MPHISRQFLKGDSERKLVQAMLHTLATKGTGVRRARIARELLTGVERLMLAKRLAVVVLLARDVPVDAIAGKLMVSPSTVSRLRKEIEAGKFDETLKAARRDKIDDLVMSFVKTIVLGPRQRTASRWRWLKDY